MFSKEQGCKDIFLCEWNLLKLYNDNGYSKNSQINYEERNEIK